MSIIHTVLTRSEVKRISLADRDYLKRKLEVKCLLSNIMRRPINKELLADLQCILDSKPIPRRKTERRMRAGKVAVYNSAGVLVRIEHANGKVLRYV